MLGYRGRRETQPEGANPWRPWPALLTIVSAFHLTLFAQIDARMLRQPDVSQTHIAFVYAGDIWVVPKKGGTAARLSSPQGEESLPRFSPDGNHIAFNANYDGNTDIYVVPTSGGLPTRVTYHPGSDRVLDWYPDGQSILLASGMDSGRQRFNQFFKVSRDGGLPARLRVPYGEFGAISADGKWLAYTPRSRDFRTWKRYRGGMASDIWLFNLEDDSASRISEDPADDGQPMWHRHTIYYLSDRGADQRHNIWAYSIRTKKTRQVTHFRDFDIHFPSIGPSDLVFEAGGRLYLLNLRNDRHREVSVRVVTDRSTLRARTERVGKQVQGAWISPTGKRVLLEARGEIFSVPAEHGVIRNLTRTSGVAERFPSWSPDGKQVAYWSDRSGEYELVVRSVNGSGEKKVLTSLGNGFRYQCYWSPDSKKIAFIDEDVLLRLLNVESGDVQVIDRGEWLDHDDLSSFSLSWSSDNRWIAYAKTRDRATSSIYLYDTRDGQVHQVTSGYYADALPSFDPDGKYLYFVSNRTLQPVYSDLDNSWVYPNTTNLVAVPLRKDVPSPLQPRNDDEEIKEESDKEKAGEEANEKEQKPGSEAEEEAGADQDEKKGEKGVEIDLEGFERRLVVLPPEAGNYSGVAATKGKVLYLRRPRSGASRQVKRALVYYDLKERKEQTILSDVHRFRLSADGKRVLVTQGRRFGIIEVKPKQKIEKPLRVAELEMTVDPKAEWRQIFRDAWRFERDYFYDPNMHGVDWKAVGEQYEKLIDDAVTRWDVNFVLGEMIGELNASHTYRSGGDTQSSQQRNVGMLGIDWAVENSAYRIKRIVRGADWDSEIRSPLDEPGLKVQEGDYILAVNGVPMDTSRAPWAAFQALGGKTVSLTVNSEPSLEESREVLVKPLTDESRLRHLEWIEQNRSKVDQASGGRVGYIYVRSTGVDGQTELVRQFSAQFKKPALIIDERFNSGGQIPDRFVELLNRPALSYWAVRDGSMWQWPPNGHFGPKVMLINGWSGSGGDAFPYYFREAGLGPLIGTRTWGGLIGISGSPSLIDGGGVTVPTFRMLSTSGEWFEEGHGVEPDIEVLDHPTAMSKGGDPQLERAIEEVLRLLESNPPAQPEVPGYEDRTKILP